MRAVCSLIFFSGIVTCYTASGVTGHVLNYEFLRSVWSSWIDVDLVDVEVEATFSDCIAGRNALWEIPFRLPNDLYPDESHGAHHCAISPLPYVKPILWNLFSRRNNDLLWPSFVSHTRLFIQEFFIQQVFIAWRSL